MMTPVERVLALRSVHFLKDAGPRQLLGLANLARELDVTRGQTIYLEPDRADALYVVVEGRVRLSSGGVELSEVPPGQAFGTWALVDDCHRGHRAEAVEDATLLALDREDFYEFASGDVALLESLVRVLARRLKMVAEASAGEARLEGAGV